MTFQLLLHPNGWYKLQSKSSPNRKTRPATPRILLNIAVWNPFPRGQVLISQGSHSILFNLKIFLPLVEELVLKPEKAFESHVLSASPQGWWSLLPSQKGGRNPTALPAPQLRTGHCNFKWRCHRTGQSWGNPICRFPDCWKQISSNLHPSLFFFLITLRN